MEKSSWCTVWTRVRSPYRWKVCQSSVSPNWLAHKHANMNKQKLLFDAMILLSLKSIPTIKLPQWLYELSAVPDFLLSLDFVEVYPYLLIRSMHLRYAM